MKNNEIAFEGNNPYEMAKEIGKWAAQNLECRAQFERFINCMLDTAKKENKSLRVFSLRNSSCE